MNHFIAKFIMTLAIMILSSFFPRNDGRIKILLLGDSTTHGGSPILETSIEKLLAAEPSLPPSEVLNVGKGGETAYSLLNSGRYEEEIKPIENIDFIFFRYGINDWIHRKEVFPSDMKKALAQLKEDFPDAKIILMTIIPFFDKSETNELVNQQIIQIAKEESIELYDIYPIYKQKMEELGRRSMCVRSIALEDIPENYRKVVEPFTSFWQWKNADWVCVQTNEFDPIFYNLPGWYEDQHPNTTGYRFMADEIAKYLIEALKK